MLFEALKRWSVLTRRGTEAAEVVRGGSSVEHDNGHSEETLRAVRRDRGGSCHLRQGDGEKQGIRIRKAPSSLFVL